jgi:hypothetical protein
VQQPVEGTVTLTYTAKITAHQTQIDDDGLRTPADKEHANPQRFLVYL